MSRHTTEEQESAQEWAPSPPLPADHVLHSGAVLFPGAFDQHGCPLIVFPVDGQAKLSSELSKAEVVDFINYFMFLHNKKQEKESLVSVVADLRHSSAPTTRFIAETLVLLELHKQTVHTVYIIQPKKKAAVKLLLKLLAPFKSSTASLKKVLLKEVLELSNYIDRSQLTAPLGGYLIYCHKSWVAFIKEMDVFVKDFVSVVQRLPSCISTLRALSRLPLPSTFNQLQHFCSTNEAKFQQLRRELGLDELLRHCESVVEKLRYPETEPCYQAMAGTALFTQTTLDMLQNHSRITAAVEKVELLWQQAFSKARLQLQVLQLREDALQITEQINLLQEKLASYKIEIAKDAAKAAMLVAEFEASIYTPAVAHVGCAGEVIHMVAEVLPFDGQTRERWVLDLERLKEELHSAVHFILQTLRAVSSYHHYYNKASRWYSLVLCENFLQELLSGVHGDAAATQRQGSKRGTIPEWRRRMSTFLKKNPSPDMEELVHLAHLSHVIPDDKVQQAGEQMSERCMTLRKLLISSGPVAVGHLQQALQWQYELLRGSHVTHSSADSSTNGPAKDGQHLPKCEGGEEAGRVLRVSPSAAASGLDTAEGKPASLSSFDSGFDGAGSSPLEAWGGRGGRGGVERSSRLARSRDSVRPASSQPQIHKDNSSSVSDSDDHREEFDFGSVGNSSRASIQIIPKVTMESLNFEIKVKRSAALPSNPWLSLPVDDLESSYTVTITQNPAAQKRDLQDPSDPYTQPNMSSRSRDQPTQTEVLSSTQSRGPQRRDWILDSESGLEDPELSPICNILSSTITEGREKSMCTTEGIPTLLWDSYDLHDQNQDTVDGSIDLSMKDWDVKEQEGLKEVEKILDRADEILEKEEEVLAQEAVLDALLRTENSQWPPWGSENQLGVMSSSELAEAGVLGLEDYLAPKESDDLSEPGSAASASEMKASDGDEQSTEADPGAGGADAAASHRRPDLLTELRNVHVLDELIMEENLKIHELRRCEENSDEELSGGNPLDMNKLSSVSKEREAFRLQLEKEKREVDKLEKSLDQQCKVKKHKDRVKKEVKCPRMEKDGTENMEDRALCEELLSGRCDKSQQAHLTSVVHIHSQDTCNTQHAQTVLGPDDAKEASAQDSVQLQDSQSQEPSSEVEPSAFNRVHSDLKAPPEEVGVQLQGKHVDRCGENTAKPEASLSPETRPDDGAFDPGGEPPLSPVPQPRKAPLSPSNDDVTEPEMLHSTEPQNPALPSAAPDPGIVQLGKEMPLDALPEDVASAVSPSVVVNANVRKHSSNNNNNCALSDKCTMSSEHLCAVSTKNEEDVSSAVVPDCVQHMDLHQAEEIQTSSTADQSPHELSAPLLPPQTLSHAGDELNGDLPSGSQRCEVMRVSGSRSPGVQAQLNMSLREMTDFKTPIVLDTGSGLMKAGFADKDLPSIIFPTIIGMPKYEEIMNGSVERETYIGHEAQHMRGILALKHPIKNGIIRNWDQMEKIWHHTFQQLGVDPDEHPVLLTEAAMNPLENRQRMVEIMFECFSVPLTYVAMQAVLALYAAGRSTGVVFDSGDGVSHSVPVFEGYCLPHAVQRFPLAGVDVTMQLKKLLQEQGVCMRTTAELEIVREMKEKCCRVALNYEAELSAGGAPCTQMSYTMPDGQIVTVGTERFRAPEILFKPELIGQDHYGMHESIFKSILSADIDLRRCFLGNIVLSGGNTLLSGLPERLQAEIRGLVPSDMGQRVGVTSPNDRDFSVWSGGAVLANLPTFSAAWISQDEYEEYGPQIVFRKCF